MKYSTCAIAFSTVALSKGDVIGDKSISLEVFCWNNQNPVPTAIAPNTPNSPKWAVE
jgi:hypothetical protein